MKTGDGIVGDDIISNLPRNVIDCILERMPIQDAVRTSVLSTSWRYNWTTISKLNFDYDFTQHLKSKSLMKSDFVRIVSNILLLHDGPIYCVSFCIDFGAYCEAIEDLKKWLIFLSRHGIKELNYFQVPSSDCFKLPRCVYGWVKLTHLCLTNCILEPPSSFTGLPNLISIKFNGVSFKKDFFGNLDSWFPSLEKLFLTSCSGLDCLDIVSPTLKHLSISATRSASLYVSAENLKELVLSLFTKKGTEVRYIALVPGIEKLYLSESCLELLNFDGPVETHPPPLIFLKSLEIRMFQFGNSTLLVKALRLIRSAPNLQELIFLDVWYEDLDDAKCRDSCFLGDDCKLSCLKVVKFSGCEGSPLELQMIKLLLASSPSLETMFIQLDEDVCPKVGSKMTKELLRYRRASANAEIIFSDPAERAEIIFSDPGEMR